MVGLGGSLGCWGLLPPPLDPLDEMWSCTLVGVQRSQRSGILYLGQVGKWVPSSKITHLTARAHWLQDGPCTHLSPPSSALNVALPQGHK